MIGSPVAWEGEMWKGKGYNHARAVNAGQAKIGIAQFWFVSIIVQAENK